MINYYLWIGLSLCFLMTIRMNYHLTPSLYELAKRRNPTFVSFYFMIFIIGLWPLFVFLVIFAMFKQVISK